MREVTSIALGEEHEIRMEALRRAVQEGFDSGEPIEFDFDAFLEAKKSGRR